MKLETKYAAAASHVLVPLALVLLTLVWATCPARAQTPTPTPTPLWVQTGTNDINSNNAGNVGIGTPTPTSKLDVSGTAAVSGDLKVGAGRLKFSFSGPEGLIQGNTERLSFWTTNGSGAQVVRMRFGGNSATSTAEFLNLSSVLIGSGVKFALGTTAPEGILDVRGGIAASGAGLPLILSAQQGSSSGGAGGNVIINSGPNGASSPNGSIIFGTGGSITAGVLTTGEKMRIDDAGRVGLGTTAPLQKLQLGTNTAAATTTPDAISLGATYSSAAGANPKLRLFDNNAGSVYGLGISDSQFDFMVPTGARYVWSMNGSEKMRLDASGTFGIGTATPNSAYKLDVSGSINGSGLCIAGVCKTDWSQIGGPASQWTTSGTSVYYNTGNVGIGTTSPGSKLSVEGNAYTVSGTSSPLYEGFRVRASDYSTNNGYLLFGKQPGTAGYGVIQSGDTVAYRNLLLNPLGGNVGIGTTTPTGKLSIVDGNQLSIYTTPGYGSTFTKDGLTVVANPDPGYSSLVIKSGHSLVSDRGLLRLFRYDGISPQQEMMYVRMDGNVGFGTVTPGYRLDVQGGQINASGGLCIAGVCKTDWSQIGGAASQWTTTSSNIFYNSGNVGIGTSTPNTAKLVIVGTAGAEGLDLSSADQYANLRVIRNSNSSFDKDLFLQYQAGPGSKIHFYSNNTESMTLNAGNVGIGTASPGYKLHVAGGSLGVQNSGNDAIVQVASGAANESGTFGWSTSGFTYLQGGAWGGVTNKLVLQGGGGNVGIGMVSPTHKLDVQGDINATGAITGATINASYQDVAEWVPSRQELQAGTVVVLDAERNNHVLASTSSYDTRVAGVVSASPGVILGQEGNGKLKVATTGRVKVKVDATRAPIKVGDLLVTSDVEGVAMKSEPLNFGGAQLHRPGTLIGKALEPLASGTGEILVLLSLQ